MDEICIVVNETTVMVASTVLGMLTAALAANFLPNPVDVNNKFGKTLLTIINWIGLNIKVNTVKK